ncbi:MAG: imidazole glycerol phosphate synthase subunit HisH [Lachnospiraceae bacterium]|nr:imidazole glycerol phosphate synthase subunit HisH [Lachnospiraceae bacterium]
MVAVIDYDAGNIRSVVNALKYLGADHIITNDRDKILNADRVILPGVGAFGDAMGRLRSSGLDETIAETVSKGTPFLGVCLGLQLLFEESEESPGVRGLALLKGRILRIPDGEYTKIPHMGWNSLTLINDGRLFEGTGKEPYVYFVHSYYLKAADESIVTAVTDYNTKIHASVEKDNLFGCQFHPEKSSSAGLKMLENFLKV